MNVFLCECCSWCPADCTCMTNPEATQQRVELRHKASAARAWLARQVEQAEGLVA